MNPFRRPERPQDGPEPAPDPTSVTVELIEQVAQLRGQVRALETEWDDIRVQIRKSYQRMEKAYQRLEEAGIEESDPVPRELPGPPLVGFAKKLAESRGA